jgi:nitrogen regulatory protein PII
MARPFIPKLQQYIVDNPEKLKEIADKIKGVNNDGKKEGTDSEEIQTL